MKYYIYLLVLIGSILMVNQHAIAQTTESQTEQFQNRIVDSIFSKTLSESRDFWVRLPDNFHNQTKPIFDKIRINKQENQKLAELRDWLLPMLMNGQVRVK